jgi:quaternary ammonium compound-resistance protein SugE
MNWIILVIAGLLEVVWAVGLKQSAGFTKFWPSIGTAAAIIISLLMLSLAMRTLPAGTAYAVWSGIGTVGTVVVGIFWMGDPVGMLRIASLVLILTGIVGLKIATPG